MLLSKKSRFTGFFAFVLLSACQPLRDSQSELMAQAETEPAAAMRLAGQRLASGEYDAALHWFRQAAQLGDAAALQHALQLQQRQHGRLATAQWLQQQLTQGVIAPQAVSAVERQTLGLWQAGAAGIAGYRHQQGCQLTIQPVVTQLAGKDNWQQLLQQWQQDSQLSQLAVCFLPLQQVPSTELACTEQSSRLISCHYQPLASLVASGRFSQLLLLAGRGKASYNNGILQLPDNASLALLRHEFMHVLGFIDEYRLPLASAQQLCQPGRLHPNILLAEQTAAYLQHWQLAAADISLTPVDSCALVGKQAYRVLSEPNVMRSFELGLPELYLQLAKHILSQPEQLMPVQYYFAYLARQQQNWPQWQHFMQQASDWGYADAQQALAP